MRQVIRDLEIEIKENEVLNYLGYVAGKTEINPEIMFLVKKMIEEAKELYTGLCIVSTQKIKLNPNNELTLPFASKINFNSLTVKEKLKKNTRFISLIAVTIGGRLEQKVEELFTRGRYTESLILDAVGSAAVENLADQLEKEMNKKAEIYGYSLTPRFSPGYGDWPLFNQREIIRAINAEEFGITVNHSDMLIPRKSITAILGWSKGGSEPEQKCINKCSHCAKSDCKFRSN